MQIKAVSNNQKKEQQLKEEDKNYNIFKINYEKLIINILRVIFRKVIILNQSWLLWVLSKYSWNILIGSLRRRRIISWKGKFKRWRGLRCLNKMNKIIRLKISKENRNKKTHIYIQAFKEYQTQKKTKKFKKTKTSNNHNKMIFFHWQFQGAMTSKMK